MGGESTGFDLAGEIWRLTRNMLKRKESEMDLQEAMGKIKQAKTMLSDANGIVNAAQAEMGKLRDENLRLAEAREPRLPEGVEWPRFEDGELVNVGDKVEHGGKAWEVDAVCLSREEWSMALRRSLDISRMSGSYDERLKRPKPKALDADGALIEVGDTVYFVGGSGTRFAVKDIDFKPDGAFVDIIDEGRYSATVNPESLTHEPPDSWERLEEDAKLAPRDYLEKRGMNPEKTERIASMMADLVRRAKALAKAGEQG